MLHAQPKHKVLRLLSCIMVFSLLLSACAVPGAAPAATDGPIELSLLNGCGPVTDPVVDMMVKNFNEAHPDIKVNIECAQGDYAEGIFAKAAAGNLPDVVFSADLFTVPFVENGVLADLETFAETDETFSFDDIYENILGLGQVAGTAGTYMIPASWDSVQMYYNKDMFEAAGAPVPADDWSWDNLIEACKTIQAANSEVDCISIGGVSGWDWWAYVIPWIVGYGGEPVSEDFKTSTFSSEESVAGLQAYVDLWTVHDVMMPLGTDYPGGGQGCFIGQSCAVFFSIPGLMKTFREQVTDFTWDVAVTPSHPIAHATGMGTFGYGISKNSQHPQEAWELLKYLGSAEAQGELLRTYVGIPFLKSMADSPIFAEMAPPPTNVKAFIAGGEIGIFPPMGYPSKCGSLYAGLINQTIRTGLEEAIRGVKTVEQAFIDADAEIQACLDTVQ